MTFATDGRAGVDYTKLDTSAEFKLGQVSRGSDGTDWVYIKSTAAITQYDWVAIDEDFTALAGTKALADVGHKVGWAQTARTSTTSYGWVATGGSNIKGRVAQSCAPDAALYTTSTAGILDDTSASQTKILGVVAVTSGSTSGAKAVEIVATYPHAK